MADIKLLPKDIAELIAAGEVVERPASVIKELVEIAIDAGADKITVEIQRGGISFMRVTDNGCGIKPQQVRTAFLRHATSKIKTQDDLFRISTLGFRGEALSSISSVSMVEMLTKTADAPTGVRYCIEGGIETEFEETACPNGTTIIIRDLFFNTPARMKFLKKDISEGTAVSAVIDAVALSHPEISIRFIKDHKPLLSTSGDGKLGSAVYSVLGREIFSGLIPADATTSSIRVSGLICKPVYCRPTRSAQYFFLNNRYIRSGVIAKALDQAYKSTVMVGKFPACVLRIEMPFDRVDVNVHPAKTEVRFSDDKAIFDAVYYAVKNALAAGDTRPQLELNRNNRNTNKQPERMTVEEFKKLTKANKGDNENPTPVERIYGAEKTVSDNRSYKQTYNRTDVRPSSFSDFEKPLISDKTVSIDFSYDKKETSADQATPPTARNAATKNTVPAFEQIKSILVEDENKFENISFMEDTEIEFKYIGEAFRTYLIVQYKGSLYFIDKHAAHERMLYNQLKAEGVTEVQTLLSPVPVTLSREEYRAVCDNLELLAKAGFEVEPFGTVSVIVRAVPASLENKNIMFLMCSIAANLVKYGKAETEILDDLYHNIACRSAIKGGNIQSGAEMEEFARKVISSKDIMYCPHGRPVAFELKQSEIEKQFGRTK